MSKKKSSGDECDTSGYCPEGKTCVEEEMKKGSSCDEAKDTCCGKGGHDRDDKD